MTKPKKGRGGRRSLLKTELARYLHRKGWTYARFAESVGESKRTVDGWGCGRHKTPGHILKKIRKEMENSQETHNDTHQVC